MIEYCNFKQAIAKSKIRECKYYTNGHNLLDKYDRSSSLCKKLKYDYNINTGVLNKDVEKNLNSIGIFDSEIEDMDDRLLNSLNKCDEYSIAVTYYEENSDGVWVDMDSSDIDDYIEEYSEELLEMDSRETFNLFSIGAKKHLQKL